MLLVHQLWLCEFSATALTSQIAFQGYLLSAHTSAWMLTLPHQSLRYMGFLFSMRLDKCN